MGLIDVAPHYGILAAPIELAQNAKSNQRRSGQKRFFLSLASTPGQPDELSEIYFAHNSHLVIDDGEECEFIFPHDLARFIQRLILEAIVCRPHDIAHPGSRRRAGSRR
jgi:hypothetical protein